MNNYGISSKEHKKKGIRHTPVFNGNKQHKK